MPILSCFWLHVQAILGTSESEKQTEEHAYYRAAQGRGATVDERRVDARTLEMNDPLSQSQVLDQVEIYMNFFLRGQCAIDVPSDSIAPVAGVGEVVDVWYGRALVT